MKPYKPREIEPKWQQIWAETGLYRTDDSAPGEKKYFLDMFPYPSGDGLHVGHVRNFVITDIAARFSRMQGNNVLHPIGWDAFGLPTENYAIKTGVSPQEATKKNTDNFRAQMQKVALSYDWSREINSSSPEYYKWTQLLFTILFERGLAYQKESEQWWCDTDKTVLANEQVESGRCWRCKNPVSKKTLKQWFFRITNYADRLLADIDGLDWPEGIKAQQRNWIGKSEGAEISFELEGLGTGGASCEVYTTRPDTLFGATFLVVAPEVTRDWMNSDWSAPQDVIEYYKATIARSEIERQEAGKTKTGVDTGLKAIHPLTGKKIPVWTADYVLAGYGTGVIMAVPAHDERDYAFAKAFDLPIVEVIAKPSEFVGEVFTGKNSLINSGAFDGKSGAEAMHDIIKTLFDKKAGHGATNYKLRDWLISRQRYWGAPIPIIHCPKDGAVAVPNDQLPVVLPELEDYHPTDDGKSPLAKVDKWVNVECPKCGGPAKRETDTMDTFACSSWYFLRFADPHNTEAAFDLEKVKQWLPVDTYVGGAEHAVLHLLYARFWTKVLFDAKFIDFEEPFKSLRNQGMVNATDGRKMSKSYGNVINPNAIIESHGADTLRLYEMFMAPYNEQTSWSDERLGGVSRFLYRTWTLAQNLIENDKQVGEPDGILGAQVERITHQTIKKVTEDMGEMRFNTMVSALMQFVNALTAPSTFEKITKPENSDLALRTVRELILMLAPSASHMTEELWQQLGETESVHIQPWPMYDPEKVKEDLVTIVVQVNGKLRDEFIVEVAASNEDLETEAKSSEKVAVFLEGKEIVKVIVVPRKLVNFVVR